MKKSLFITVLLIILTAALKANAYSGGYIVKFKEGYSPIRYEYSLKTVSEDMNLYLADSIEQLRGIEEFIEYYEPNKTVELIEGLETLSLSEPSNNELYAGQWQLQMLNVDRAWDIETYGNDVRVAVIDSGCSAHTDLAANVLEGKNYFNGSTDVTDDKGHGTHVSGIIAAGMNDTGIIGVAPKAKIVPLKCFKASMNPTVDMVIRAIDDAINVYNCRIINMSWGMAGVDNALKEAVDYAYRKGVILVASVGNKGSTQLYYPAAYDSVIGVGSVTKSKERSSFSQHNSSVFAVTSGQDVMSTYNNGGYYSLSGTSQAAPFVSGLAAVALSADGSLTVDRFRQLIIDSSKDLGEEGYDTEFGYGLVDAEAMLDLLLAGKPCYVSPVNVKDGRAYVYIKNNGPDVLEAVSIFARYNDGIFSGITRNSISLLSGGDTLSAADFDGNAVSHLLWKALKPAADKRVFSSD